MLFRQKIISFKIKNKIIFGLNKIEKEILKNKFEYNKKYEDIHMNIEKRLFQIIGEEAGYVHTARSRNDQVITDFKMWTTSATKEINKNLDNIIKTILKTSEKLGFKRPTNNSIDTVADRDFVLDFLYSASVCSMHISRIAEELIIWNSDGFNLITLSDKVVTGSSIMPQKKNPDLLEYLRGKTGSTYGNLFSMLTILKGLPISYFKDLQDDKEILFKSNEVLNNCIAILNEVLKNLKPNKQQMLNLANSGYITATDLADYLVKNHSMPFRKAYQTTASIVNYAEKKKKKLNELNIDELKKIEPRLTIEVLKIFNVKNSVNSKKSYGGTSFDNIKKMIMKYKKSL